MLRKLYEGGYFKGRLKEAYINRSPISVSLCTIPMDDALAILDTMDLTNQFKRMEFFSRFTEEQIATNGWASYRYAQDVLKGRFALGEPAIRGNWGQFTSSDTWHYYKQFVLSKAPYNMYPGTAPQAMTEG